MKHLRAFFRGCVLPRCFSFLAAPQRGAIIRGEPLPCAVGPGRRLAVVSCPAPHNPPELLPGGDPRTGTGQASKQALRFLLPTRPLMRGHVPFQHFLVLSGAVADGAGVGPLVEAAITLREL